MLKKMCTQNQNTHCMFNNFSESSAIYGIKWKNTVEENRAQIAIQQGECALHAGQLRLQDTHSEYVIIIIVFAQ